MHLITMRPTAHRENIVQPKTALKDARECTLRKRFGWPGASGEGSGGAASLP